MPTWLTIDQAAEYVGPRRAGRPTHRDTIKAWMRKGLRGVRLQYLYRGCRPFTTAAWTEEFFSELTAARRQEQEQARADVPPSPGALRRRYRAAAERNRREGIR